MTSSLSTCEGSEFVLRIFWLLHRPQSFIKLLKPSNCPISRIVYNGQKFTTLNLFIIDKSHQSRIPYVMKNLHVPATPKGMNELYTRGMKELAEPVWIKPLCVKNTSNEDVASQSKPENYLETTPILTFNLPESALTSDTENKRINDILTYVFGKEIKIQFNAIVQEHCQGCQTNHVSQLKHSCFWMEDDDCEVNGLLKRALAKTDISYLKTVCCEMANILNLKLPLSFFVSKLSRSYGNSCVSLAWWSRAWGT